MDKNSILHGLLYIRTNGWTCHVTVKYWLVLIWPESLLFSLIYELTHTYLEPQHAYWMQYCRLLALSFAALLRIINILRLYHRWRWLYFFPALASVFYCSCLNFLALLFNTLCVRTYVQVDLSRRHEVVVYDQSTKDAGQLSKDGFVHILLSKLDGTFHKVSLLTGKDAAMQIF